jgi:hypothetical protein
MTRLLLFIFSLCKALFIGPVSKNHYSTGDNSVRSRFDLNTYRDFGFTKLSAFYANLQETFISLECDINQERNHAFYKKHFAILSRITFGPDSFCQIKKSLVNYT